MIIENDSIGMRNVISERCFVHYSQFPQAAQAFFAKIDQMNLTPIGDFFYSLNNVPVDGDMAIELFLTIRQTDIPPCDGLIFHSYFTVQNMLMTYLTEDFEKKTEFAYAELLLYMQENDLEMASPIFHFFKGTRDVHYAELKVGVKDADS